VKTNNRRRQTCVAATSAPATDARDRDCLNFSERFALGESAIRGGAVK
jgi:hypothetical protein